MAFLAILLISTVPQLSINLSIGNTFKASIQLFKQPEVKEESTKTILPIENIIRETSNLSLIINDIDLHINLSMFNLNNYNLQTIPLINNFITPSTVEGI